MSNGSVREAGTGFLLNTCLLPAPALPRSVCYLLFVACGISVPDQGSSLGTLNREPRVTHWTPGKSHRAQDLSDHQPMGHCLIWGWTHSAQHRGCCLTLLRPSAEPGERHHPQDHTPAVCMLLRPSAEPGERRRPQGLPCSRSPHATAARSVGAPHGGISAQRGRLSSRLQLWRWGRPWPGSTPQWSKAWAAGGGPPNGTLDVTGPGRASAPTPQRSV